MDLHPIAETAERLGAKEFVATLKKSGLESMLEKDLTLFAVPDSAYSQFTEQMWENVSTNAIHISPSGFRVVILCTTPMIYMLSL